MPAVPDSGNFAVAGLSTFAKERSVSSAMVALRAVVLEPSTQTAGWFASTQTRNFMSPPWISIAPSRSTSVWRKLSSGNGGFSRSRTRPSLGSKWSASKASTLLI